MTLTLAKKLTLSFLILTVIVLIATLGLARWSFERGFLDYINTVEQQRLRALSKQVLQEYIDANEQWSSLSPQKFYSLVHLLPQEKRQPPPSSSRHAPPKGHAPRDAPRRRPPPRPESAYGSGSPTGLFDKQGVLIAGRGVSTVNAQVISVPILFNGMLVAELRSAPRQRFTTSAEAEFSKQHIITSGLIGIMSLVLALMVAVVLTRRLLAPIHRMMKGVSLLSNGDYGARLNSTRKDELGQLMKNLDYLARTLEENRASQRRWLADISHELRTPVTVLTGEIETLKDGIRPFNMEQVLSIDQEISRLRYLIDDLYQLSLADIGGLRYTFTPCDIGALITGVVDNFRPRASKKNLQLILSLNHNSGDGINGDQQRLVQLLTNLLENALAYTHAPGNIEIISSSTKEAIMLYIQDTAPGVEDGNYQKVFEPLFRQESSRSRNSAGAGLGLAICKNIVEAHRGSISASPSKLGGLCITLTFPKIERC